MLIEKAILKINPNASFVIRGTEIEDCIIEFTNGTATISKADIQAQFPIVKFDMAMEDLRAKRNKLLTDTDFHALSDQTLSPEMSAYRQALRDITNGITTKEQIDAIIWPTKPGA